jgi:hypothetical protein
MWCYLEWFSASVLCRCLAVLASRSRINLNLSAELTFAALGEFIGIPAPIGGADGDGRLPKRTAAAHADDFRTRLFANVGLYAQHQSAAANGLPAGRLPPLTPQRVFSAFGGRKKRVWDFFSVDTHSNARCSSLDFNNKKLIFK